MTESRRDSSFHPNPNSSPDPGAREPSLPIAQRAVRGGAIVALVSWGTILFGFLANLVLTRMLSPEDFGAFSLALFFFSVLNLRTKLGLDAAFAQQIETNGTLMGTYLVMSATTGVASLVLALVGVPLFAWLGYSPMIPSIVVGLAIIGVSDSVMVVAWSLLDKQLLFGRSSTAIALAFPLSYAPAFYLAANGAGAWSLIGQSATYSILLLVSMWIVFRRYLPQFWITSWRLDAGVARSFVRFGAVVGLAAIGATLLFQFDNFLVGTFVGISALGFYDRAYKIAQWPHLLVSSVLTRTAFYVYAQLQNDQVRLAKTVRMSIWLVTRLALPIALGIFMAAPDLVILLFGERWLPSAFYLRLLLVFSVIRPLLEDAGSFFVAIGQPRRQLNMVLLEATVLVLLGTPLTLAWGVPGTALGVGIAFLVGLVFTYHLVRQTILLSLRKTFAVPAFALIFTLALYWLSTQAVNWNLLPLVARVCLKLGFGIMVYLGIASIAELHSTIDQARYILRLLIGRGSPSEGLMEQG